MGELSTACPKLGKSGRTWREDRELKRSEAETALRRVHKLVDVRDRGHCRVCGKRVVVGGTGKDRAERHHIVARSLGGQHTTENLATLCVGCHDQRHKKGTLALAGDADSRNEMGKLAGIHVQRLTEGGWRTVGWV